MREAELLSALGANHVAFYDDALLAQNGLILKRFLEHVASYGLSFRYVYGTILTQSPSILPGLAFLLIEHQKKCC